MTNVTKNNFTRTINLDSKNASYPWMRKTFIHDRDVDDDVSHTTNNTNNTNNTNKSKKEVFDSHTAYRKLLEGNTVTLKLELAEAQERADTLQNDLNLFMEQWRTNHQSLEDLEHRYNESQRLAEGLATVVKHLQENANVSAAERSALRMEIRELKNEKDGIKKEKKSKRKSNGDSDDDASNSSSGSSRKLPTLPKIPEFREILKPLGMSTSRNDLAGLVKSPTEESSAEDSVLLNNINNGNNNSASPPFKSDIKFGPGSGKEQFDPYSVFKKKHDIHIEKVEVKVPEDDSFQDNNADAVSSSKKQRDRGGSVKEKEETTSEVDIPEQWGRSSPSSEDENDAEIPSVAGRLTGTIQALNGPIQALNGWWNPNGNEPENTNPTSSPVPEQQQQQQRRMFTPWFLNGSANDNDASPPSPTREDGSDSIDEDSYQSRFWNPLAPRRVERPGLT